MLRFTLNPSLAHFNSEQIVRNLYGSPPKDRVILYRR